jgi:Ca2+-binding RTX toxin-like protein
MPDYEAESTESKLVADVAPETNDVIGGEEAFAFPDSQARKSDESTDEYDSESYAVAAEPVYVEPGYNEINGTAGDDSLNGTENADAMYGLGGDDLLKGLGGDDALYGGDGSDVLWGQGGDDTLFGGSGDDQLKGHGGADTLEGGLGSDVLDGGGGTDTLSYAGSSAGVTVDLTAGTASGGDAQGDTFANFENLTGSEYADSLTGDSGDNVLTGGGGADTLDGGAGDDYLIGGTGDDVATGGDGADTFLLMEAWGSDTFHGGAGGGWTDVVELQDANGNAPTDGWSFTLTTGSVVSQGDGFIELSDDSAGTITLDDGTSLIFDEVEKFIW